MINKKSLWFLTLFSLILVLSVYYVTMPNELLLTNNNNYTKEEKNENKDNTVNVNLEESSILVALRVEAEEEMMKELDELEKILTDVDSTVEEKNNAFEKMKDINVIRGEEETLEKKILDEFKLKAFVKIDGDQIRVVVATDKLDNETANKIMRSLQENYKTKMYISVKFQK